MKKPINPRFPVTEVTSLAQLMDIATAVEREAAARFDELAARLAAQGNTETAALFRELAEEERAHEDEIARWAARDDHHMPVPAEFQWRMPETFDLAQTETSSYTLTPYQALSVAVRNEERTFAFYTYLAALADNDQVRARAEALATGELGHVARLRAKRRQAYHAEHRAGAGQRRRAASLAELQRIAHGLELGSAQLNDALALALEQTGEVTTATLMRRLANDARTGAERAITARGELAETFASQAAQAARASGVLEPGALTAAATLRLALKDAEEVAQIYLDITESARDEGVMSAAQGFSERAVARLAVISARLDEY